MGVRSRVRVRRRPPVRALHYLLVRLALATLAGFLFANASAAAAPRSISDCCLAARGVATAAEVALPALSKLPGSAGVQVAGRLSPAQMVALTKKHGVEFSLVYRTGAGRAGGGGTYWLYSGSKKAVSVPVGSNVRWIYHTHPGGTAAASGADRNVLRLLQQAGSPQRSSQVVPAGKDVVRFSQ